MSNNNVFVYDAEALRLEVDTICSILLSRSPDASLEDLCNNERFAELEDTYFEKGPEELGVEEIENIIAETIENHLSSIKYKHK